jgi:hypothetical protein
MCFSPAFFIFPVGELACADGIKQFSRTAFDVRSNSIMWQSVKTSLPAVLVLSAFLYLSQQSIAQAEDQNFTQWDGKYTVWDAQGVRWQLDEAQLKATDGRVLHRLPAHRAFWFGWFSAYNHTRLVH